MKSSFSNELAKEILSFKDENRHFQPTETLLSDELVGEQVDSFSNPTRFIPDEFTLKSLNEIYSEEFNLVTKNINNVPNVEEFYPGRNSKESTNVEDYFSSNFAKKDLSKHQFRRKSQKLDENNFQTQISTTKNKHDKSLFLNLKTKTNTTSTNSKLQESDCNIFGEDSAKWHERSETFYHQTNYDQTAEHSKSLIEVVHRDVAYDFKEAGVHFSTKKCCNNISNAIVQKSISLNDVHSENFYENLHNHLMVIINDDSKSMLKTKINTYFH